MEYDFEDVFFGKLDQLYRSSMSYCISSISNVSSPGGETENYWKDLRYVRFRYMKVFSGSSVEDYWDRCNRQWIYDIIMSGLKVATSWSHFAMEIFQMGSEAIIHSHVGDLILPSKLVLYKQIRVKNALQTQLIVVIISGHHIQLALV